MMRALVLARHGRGKVSPNPLVGALVVKNHVIVGSGYHAEFGADHAEVVALRAAGEAAFGATLYVTLEPCNHFGNTPPCVDQIIASGIRKVVFAIEDTNPKVSGGGAARLRESGIEVVAGVCREEAFEINRSWFFEHVHERPMVIVKLAQSLDGRIAFQNGVSQWISNSAARRQVHALRGTVDAVMVGAQTAIVDRPQLNNRGRIGSQPHRVIIDSVLRIPAGLPCLHPLRTDDGKERLTYVITTAAAPHEKRDELTRHGARIIVSATKNGGIDLSDALVQLHEAGIHSILCEGGGRLTGSLIAEYLCDILILYQAPFFIGENGIPNFSVPGLGLSGSELDKERFTFSVRDLKRVGENLRIVLEPARASGIVPKGGMSV